MVPYDSYRVISKLLIHITTFATDGAKLAEYYLRGMKDCLETGIFQNELEYE